MPPISSQSGVQNKKRRIDRNDVFTQLSIHFYSFTHIARDILIKMKRKRKEIHSHCHLSLTLYIDPDG